MNPIHRWKGCAYTLIDVALIGTLVYAIYKLLEWIL